MVPSIRRRAPRSPLAALAPSLHQLSPKPGAAEKAAATPTTHELHASGEDVNQTVEAIARSNAEPKPEQLSMGTTAAQTVANAAAEKAAAAAAAGA